MPHPLVPGKVNDPQSLIATDTVNVTWSPPVGILTGYKVGCTPLPGDKEESSEEAELDTVSSFIKTLDSSCREVSVEGLDTESEYKIQIWVLSGEKQGESVTLMIKTMSLDSESN